MSTKEQSATLLRLNKQEQVKALQEVGFADITDDSRASEFGMRIRWAGGLLDVRLACNRISDNSKWYFTASEWDSLTAANKQLFIKRGVYVRAHSQAFVIAAQDRYNGTSALFNWGGKGKIIDGISGRLVGDAYTCFTGEEDTGFIIAALKGTETGGVVGAPAAEAARAYKAYTLEGDGIEDDSNWYLPSLGQLLLVYRYRDKIDELFRKYWSNDSVLSTDKSYWSSTIYDINSAWSVLTDTGNTQYDDKNLSSNRVRPVASE